MLWMNTYTALVPVFNEEKFVTTSLDRLFKIRELDQILIIDDGSTDNSVQLIEESIKNKENCTLIKFDNNKGKGQVLKRAQQHLSTSHVVIHDADLEYFPDDIISMIEKASNHKQDLILGSRFIGNLERKNLYKRTLLANKIMSKFFSIVNNRKVSDIATCYKLMTTQFFTSIEIKEKGFSIEVEILSKFLKTNKEIIEVPIKYEGRGYDEGKKIKAIDGIFYMFNILKYKLTS